MAATCSLIQMLAAGCANTDGTPIASGKARFYQPGTLTPVTVYSDSAGTTAITPPLTLTAGGTGAAYTQQPTRMIVKDATDTNTLVDANVNTTRAESLYIQSAAVNGGAETTLQTLLTAWSTSFGGSAGLLKYKAFSDATERNVKDVITEIQVSVKNYGAVGDGVTDDTAAIQATITKVAALGGGIVYFPPGTYLVSNALSITARNVNLVGAGQATIIKSNHVTANVLTFTPSGTAVIQNRVVGMKITHAASSSGSAISGQSIWVDGVYVSELAFRYGITASGGSRWFVSNSVIGGNSGDASSVAINVTAATGFVMSSSYALYAGNSQSAVQFATAGNAIVGSTVSAINTNSVDAVKVLSGGGVYISSSALSGPGGHAVNIANGAGDVLIGAANSLSPDVLDSRSASPQVYSLAVNGSVTPLPLQTGTVKVTATAAITVTINATAATEWGRTWKLYCVNNSGGAVTWTFNAQYKTSAAVAPATGNMIIVTFEYDPAAAVVREIARSGTIPI